MVFYHMLTSPPMTLRYPEIDGYKVDESMYDNPDPRLEMVVQYGKWFKFFREGKWDNVERL
jgi:hypothetical protein